MRVQCSITIHMLEIAEGPLHQEGEWIIAYEVGVAASPDRNVLIFVFFAFWEVMRRCNRPAQSLRRLNRHRHPSILRWLGQWGTRCSLNPDCPAEEELQFS